MTAAGWRRLRAAASLVGLLLAAAIALAAQQQQAGRIVAIGDVHGNLGGLARILADTGLIDEQERWVGGQTVLVQVGDLLDRGSQVRGVLDLLMSLQPQAEAAGGRVICLLGNHEADNLLGVRNDVSTEAYAAFADSRSTSRQAAAWDTLVAFYEARARYFGQPPPRMGASVRARWLQASPPGGVEYAAALRPEGRYGRWLRSLPVMVRLGDVLFVHGGISPALAALDLDTVNRRAREEIATYDRIKEEMEAAQLALPDSSVRDMARVVEKEVEAAANPKQADRDLHQTRAEAWRPLLDWEKWLLVSPDGPLWFRGLARWNEAEHAAEVAAALEHFGVRRIVVGHTVTPSHRIQLRFGGAVVLIDTGMLSSYFEGGRASALEMRGDALTAVYDDHVERLEGGATDPGPTRGAQEKRKGARE